MDPRAELLGLYYCDCDLLGDGGPWPAWRGQYLLAAREVASQRVPARTGIYTLILTNSLRHRGKSISLALSGYHPNYPTPPQPRHFLIIAITALKFKALFLVNLS